MLRSHYIHILHGYLTVVWVLCLYLQETTAGLAIFSLAILGPAGWVLANLENYKKRDSAASEWSICHWLKAVCLVLLLLTHWDHHHTDLRLTWTAERFLSFEPPSYLSMRLVTFLQTLRSSLHRASAPSYQLCNNNI